MRGGAIPMPADDLTGAQLPPLPLDAAVGDNDGGAAPSGGWLTIAAVAPTALALPTKTRPKRLRLLASDGTAHAFLLKGRDDLRVDERLMQFTRAANAVTATAAVTGVTGGCGGAAGGAPLGVREYSVTPLGDRAGLVQWVRGTASLFALFRSWQAAAAARAAAVAAARRAADAAAGASPAGGGEGDDPEVGPQLPLMVAAARPSDAFYARLQPALRASGVPPNAPRKDWPSGAALVRI